MNGDIILQDLAKIESILFKYFFMEEEDILNSLKIERVIDNLFDIYSRMNDCSDFNVMQKEHVKAHIDKYCSWLNVANNESSVNGVSIANMALLTKMS